MFVLLTLAPRSNNLLEDVYNNTDTSAIHYSGEWDLQTVHDAPSTSLTAPLHRTSAHGASATLDFTGDAVAVYGLRVWGNWLYNVVSILCLDSEISFSSPLTATCRHWMGNCLINTTAVPYGSLPIRFYISALDSTLRQLIEFR